MPELPVNVLVILVIAIVVLGGVILLFVIGWGPPVDTLRLEAVKNSACSTFTEGYHCDETHAADVKFNTSVKCTDNNGAQREVYNLKDLCNNCYNGVSCQSLCGCS